ncbi:hypothetical protein FSP39_015785 [Pinctada imbricata]|uniref:Mitochondria-eating protein C-terminal domain-containing protein n=1 Tax=Pinctada imbricata TaxID=66713 RepID=A0AA89C8Z0_PINIB|nr:hypothetical protein FSP39_015785 [Pinctada imbricata]
MYQVDPEGPACMASHRGISPRGMSPRGRASAYAEPEDDIAHKLCVTARKMDEMLNLMLSSRSELRSDHEDYRQDRPYLGEREKQYTEKDRDKLYLEKDKRGRKPRTGQKVLRLTSRPRSADSRYHSDKRPSFSKQEKVTFTETTMVQKQVMVELRKRIIDLERENEHLKEDNYSLRMLSEKQSKVKRSQSVEHRAQALVKAESKHLKKVISDLQQQLQDQNILRATYNQDMSALQIKVKALETELANKTAALEETHHHLTNEIESHQELRDRNMKLLAEKEVLQNKLEDSEKTGARNANHEVQIRQHLKEEYERKFKIIEKEVDFMKKRLTKRKEIDQSKTKQEVNQISEHYQELIHNLRKEKEAIQQEKDEALSGLQKVADHDKATAAKQLAKYLSKLRDIEKKYHNTQQENSQLIKEKDDLKSSLNKIREKKSKESDTINHIEEILRKHCSDLEKKIQVLELENKEFTDEKTSLEERILLREQEVESVRQQLKSTREVLENRISELHHKNDILVSKNEELYRNLNTTEKELVDKVKHVMGKDESSVYDAESQFQDVIQKFEKEKTEQDKEIQTLRKRLGEMQEEKSKRQKTDLDEQEVKRQQMRIEQLQTEMEKIKTEKDSALKRLEEIERELNKISQEAHESKSRIRKEYESEIDVLRAQKSAWLDEKEQLQARNKELEYTMTLKEQDDEDDDNNDVNYLRQQLEEVQREKESIEGRVEDVSKQLQRKEHELSVQMDETSTLNTNMKERISELNTSVDRMKKENEQLQNRIMEQERVIRHYQQKADDLLRSREEQRQEKEKLLRSASENELTNKSLFDIEIQRKQNKIRDIEESLERDLASLKMEKSSWTDEKNDLQNRLSEVASTKLRDNNASVADLSDENRPINIGDRFNEIYDNEWTDAMEKLEKELKMTEKDAVYCLIGILKNVMKKALSSVYHKEQSYCQSYIKRTIELCWLMRVQDPPLVLDFTSQNGDKVDESLYRFFTKTGDFFDFLVWPVLYLHNKGPMLKRGVVQAFSL